MINKIIAWCKEKEVLKKGIIFAVLLSIGLGFAMLSDWGPFRHRDGFCDTGVYKYVGQVIRDGGMPYRDVFDHKGPLMYILQAISGYIDTYRGEWILEFAALTISVFAIYAIARRLGCKPFKGILAVVLVFTPLHGFYTTNDGNHVGGCCCLFALPLALISLYIFLKYIQTKKVKNISVLLSGLLCGGALMLRPNLVGVWATFGIIIAVECIREKRIKDLWRFIGLFLLGVAAIVLPIIIWLAVNGALADCIEQFIGFNLYYSSLHGGRPTYKAAEFIYLIDYPAMAFILIYMVYRLVAHRTQNDIYFAILAAACLFMAIIPGNDFPHYGLIVIPGIIYPCAMLLQELPERVKRGKKMVFKKDDSIIIVAAIAVFSIMVVPTWLEIARADLSTIQKRNTIANRNSVETVQLSMQIEKYTDPSDEIVVYDSYPYPTLYNHSGRRSATRFMFFTEAVESYKNYHDEYFSTLEAKKPKIVILRVQDLNKKDFKNFLKRNNYTVVWPEKYAGNSANPKEFDEDCRLVFYRQADEKD